uniref:Uncharacterized protein n=1 Tax=Sphaerodactylus townsendi TaxID=933632 RepID=A0ACB8FY02_9SAUR
MADVPKDQKYLVQKKRGRQSRPQKNLTMAAVPKNHVQQKRRQKNLAKQSKLAYASRRNICLFRLPKGRTLQNCLLMSWCFNQQMLDNVFSLHMAKYLLGSFGAIGYRQMTMQTSVRRQHCTYVHLDFLKATIKALDKRPTKRKGTPVAKTAKLRRGYSNENLYRLAKPSTSIDECTSPSGADAMSLDAAESFPSISPAPAEALQPTLS